MWLLLACTGMEPNPDPPTDDARVDNTGDTAVATDAPMTDPIPVDDLATWLATGEYATWPAEAASHPSTGPHFGDVRTFFSPDLAASLERGDAMHPEGSASVKELFGNGNDVVGYAVMVRVGTGSGANAWYWYEVFNDSTFADGRGVGLCADCHEDGTDFVLTPWPQ